MRRFKDLSIKRKQMLIIMLTSTVALLLACAAFVVYELITFRQELTRNLSGLALRVSEKNTGELTLNYPKDAEANLKQTLLREPSIVAACIYTKEGGVFARYRRDVPEATFTPPPREREGTRFANQRLILFQDIQLDNEVIGTVYLESDLTAMYSRLNLYGFIVAAVLIASLLVAFLISSRLQRLISDPILELVGVARAISTHKNYSIRARKQSEDELGQLIDRFNEMLAQIQDRDAALQQAHNSLEKRVEERTRELQTEIVERSRAETALRVSEMKFHSVVQSANDAIVAADAESRIISWNHGAQNIFGYAEEEVLQQPLSFLMGPRHAEAYGNDLKQFTTSQTSSLVGRTVELIGKRKQGSEFPIELSVATWDAAEGKFFSAIIRDITERKRAEKALQQQFTRISLLNQITHAISERQDIQSIVQVVLGQLQGHLPVEFGSVLLYDGSSKQFNTAAVHSATLTTKTCFPTRFSLNESGLKDCLERKACYLEQTSRSEAALFQRLAHEGLSSAVAVPLTIDNKLFGVILVARPVENGFSSGECEFLRMLSEHVALAAHQARLHTELQEAYNELRQTQQAVMQQERLRALGEMASGIAHDINNALSPVVVYSELLLRNEKQLHEGAQKYLHHIKTAGEDIAHIVARMREFYRRREGNENLFAISLNALAQEVVDLTRPRWRDIPLEKGVVIETVTEFDPQLPEIRGHPSEIREAITNLILNAVDAMPAGGKVIIRTRLPHWEQESRDKTSSHVVLEVSDTGIGMEEETRIRCLEPFFSTKGQRGTGLGLAMVYGIIERHEGTIAIESTPGQGTTIRLIFPIIEGGVPLHPPLDKPAIASGLKILCIDDEPLLRELLREILEGDDHKVAVADNGATGIEAFRAAKKNGVPFDVTITDLGMPYLDGRQVAATLKKESPETPVIMLTGWGTMMKADGDLPAQVDVVLSKPPRINELREVLMRFSQQAVNPNPRDALSGSAPRGS